MRNGDEHLFIGASKGGLPSINESDGAAPSILPVRGRSHRISDLNLKSSRELAEDRDRADGHRTGREEGQDVVDLGSEDRHQRSRSDRYQDDVVGEGPEEVLLDLREGLPAELERGRHVPEVILMSTIPPVSFAMSVPLPIAIPTSALASAGASLMPSPTIATTRPFLLQRLYRLLLLLPEEPRRRTCLSRSPPRSRPPS